MTATMQYLDRFLDPLSEVLTPPVARRLAELRADPVLQARVDELAAKANQGLLSPEEETEYKSYIEAAEMLAIMQAKARRYLAEQSK